MGIPAEEFFGEQKQKNMSVDEFTAGGDLNVQGQEDTSVLLDIPRQIAFGFEDVVNLLARPLEAAFGNIATTPEGGLKFFSPDELSQLREEGRPVGLFPEIVERTEPQSIFGAGGRIAGQTLAAGPIVGRVAGFIPKPVPGVTKLARLRQFPQKIAAEAGETFARAPVVSTAIETGLGFTAGAGGFVAEQIFPDSPAAVFIGEILGGTAPLLMPIRLAMRASGGLRSTIQRARRPFTAPGGRERAATRVQRAGTPEQRAEALTELDTPTTLDPNTGEPVLSPSQRTGEPGLLSLEKAVMESSEELRRVGDVNIARANDVIQSSLKGLGDEPVVAATTVIRDAQDYLSTLLDTRVRVAAQRTDERISELGPKADREQLSRIADEEINKARVSAREQERELYGVIPVDTAVPFSQSKEKLEKFIRETGKAQQEDVPDIAKRFLGEKSQDFFGKIKQKGIKKSETTIKEMRALQSKLREVARNARTDKQKNLNMARIADDIANSITDDLSQARAGEKVADDIALAVEFSRDLNQRFSSGTVAKLLGKVATGAERVPASLTLEESIGVTGPKARQAIDDLVKVFDSPESPGSAMILDASEDFIRTKFLISSVQRGQLNVRAAQRFLVKNEEILKRLPKVRNQIEEVIESGETMAVTLRQRSKVKLDDPKVSKATMLIEKGPVETFRQISKLKPVVAAKEVQKLINRVSKDKSGEALSGLKSGFIEFLYSSSKAGVRDVEGLPFVSGFGLQSTLKNSKSVVDRLFTKEEIGRLDIVVKDLIRLEKRRTAKVTPEGIISDRPSKVFDAIAGIAGAAVGRAQAKRFGMGGTVQIPGIMASRFRDMLSSGVRDPASRLLRDMIADEELFKELLQSKLEEGGTKLSKQAVTRLSAWSAAVIAEYGGAFEKDSEQQ